MQKLVLFWFRRDLRLSDNTGLWAALTSGLPVVPVFILDKDILANLEDKDDKRLSFIDAALHYLQKQLAAKGSSLDVRHGRPEEVFTALLNDYAVQAVYTNEDYEPYARQRDNAVAKLLAKHGIAFHRYKDQVIFEKEEVTKPDGSSYRVYTPFAKKWRLLLQETPIVCKPSERSLGHLYQQAPRQIPSLQSLGFIANSKIPSLHDVDEAILEHYHRTRDVPSIKDTTRMGVHLRFGTVSIRQLAMKALALNPVYVGELIWREFFMQLLWHQPRLEAEACKKEYDAICWRNNEKEFQRWCEGETGYPIVDAGMRELRETGFMHNRVRMITASFLVKDLLIDWRWGEAWFARLLLDFELSSNNGNWQWVAGCGCDAAPYFRVFNPVTQARKFDPQESYVRKWVPALGTSRYPKAMVDHAAAKERCLKAYKAALRQKAH